MVCSTSHAEPKVRRVLRGPLSTSRGRSIGRDGTVLVLLVVIVAVFANAITAHSPIAIAPIDRFQPPGLNHLLGTDHLGRDLFARVVYGSRLALGVSLGSTALSLLLGVGAGVAAGYGPVGWTTHCC